MKYKKSIIVLMLAIFLFSITSVCASEIDTSIASDDTSQVGLSDIDKVDEDNLQTSEEKLELGVDDEILNEQTDTDVLGDTPASYSDLAVEINTPGNVTLKYKNYTYDDGAAEITVSEDNKVIDGNGAVIDMTGSSIRAFNVSASGVTIKNLTIKIAEIDGNGGAIYFSNHGTVTNCNFKNAYIDGYGGAIYFSNSGTVTNCNFDKNCADSAAAIYMDSGSVENCNFIFNQANNVNNGQGGAVYFNSEGKVSNCNFVDNSAWQKGGAIWMSFGSVSNCNFTTNQATRGGGAVYFDSNGNVTNCNFTKNHDLWGAGVFFKGNGNVTNCNLYY